jgi:hypothetical protein
MVKHAANFSGPVSNAANTYIDLAWYVRFGGPANSFFKTKFIHRIKMGILGMPHIAL